MNQAQDTFAASPSSVDWALEVEVRQQQPMALHGAFHCSPGELLALVGPSGAGKTSMLRVLAGLMRPEQGRIVVGGDVWCDTAQGIFMPAQRRHVGLVFQDYALMPHLSALDNVALSLLDLPRAERLTKAGYWLDHVHLTRDEQSRRPAALSGGQQQRVAVARALARAPRLLLLDEPFSAVDQMNRRELYRLLAELRRELAVPILLVTHDLNEARGLADSLVVMDAGHVLQQGTPDAVHRGPRNARVADLVGIHNRFQGRWEGPSAQAGWGLLRWTGHDRHGDHDDAAAVLKVRDKNRLETDQEVTWVIPSDGLTLLDRAAVNAGEFSAEVSEARQLGDMTLATLSVLSIDGASLVLTLTGPQQPKLAIGTRLTVGIDLDLVHVMPVRQG